MIYIPYPFKHCSKCDSDKIPAMFSRRKNGKLVDWCKSCNSKAAQAWNQSNRERYNKIAQSFRDNHAGEIRQADHERYLKNKDRHREDGQRWRDNNRQKVRDSNSRRRKEHPEYAAVSDHRRRSREQKAEGSFVADDIKRITKAQHGKCYYCGKKRKLTVDHIVPLSRGGTNWPDNIVMACGSCNYRKHNKLPHEWPSGGRLL